MKAGPGKYELPSMNLTGKYFYSKFNNSRCAKVGQEKRFVDHFSKEVPGPGTCKPLVMQTTPTNGCS